MYSKNITVKYKEKNNKWNYSNFINSENIHLNLGIPLLLHLSTFYWEIVSDASVFEGGYILLCGL